MAVRQTVSDLTSHERHRLAPHIVSVTNRRRQLQVWLGGGHCKKLFQKFCSKRQL